MANPNQQIITDAWERLWNKAKYPDYYLPTAILDGIKSKGVTVSPLGNLDVPQLGPFALFKKDGLGSISLTFTDNVINGLQTMSNQGITAATDGLSFTATVGVSALNSVGKFNVDATGLSMCAVDSVWAIGQITKGKAELTVGPSDDTGITAAKNYREQLLNQGPHGQALVGTYYDNNDVYNDVANDTNTTFNYNWAYYKTTGKDPTGKQVTVDSQILSTQTTSAAQNPSSTTDVVGYEAYNLHSYTGQGLMVKSLDQKIDDLKAPYKDKTIPAAVQAQIDKLQQAVDATFMFGENTMPVTKDPSNVGGISVDAVMNNVQNNTPITKSTLAEKFETGMSLAELVEGHPHSVFRNGMIEAQRLSEEHQKLRSENLERMSVHASTPVHGTYNLEVPLPTMSISGTISLDDGKLNVTITDVEAGSPSLSYQLHPADGGSSLFTEVAQHYTSASYIHQLSEQKANTSLNSDKMKSYMADRINQSINKIFG